MQLSITFRQMDPSDFLREHARQQVERVTRLLDRAGEAKVVLSVERHLQLADIQIQSGPWLLVAGEKGPDMYAAIEGAMDKIERQLMRLKEKAKNHHSRAYQHHQARVKNRLRTEESEAGPEIAGTATA